MVDVTKGIVILYGIGQEVQYNGSAYKISNIAFRDNSDFVSAGAGKLYYELIGVADGLSIGWVNGSDVSVADLAIQEDADRADDFFEQDAHSPHLLDLGYSMVKWLDGLESRPDNDKLAPIVTLLMAIQYDKEGFYGSSWKGKGEYRGIMANIDRKYDRLDKMTHDEIEGAIPTLGLLEDHLVKDRFTKEQVGESKVDAVADLANYCLLYLTYIKENYPNVFQVWVDKNVPQYLADKIPFISDTTKDTAK